MKPRKLIAMVSKEAREILRLAWKVSSKFESEMLKRKFRFNAREMVEFYSQHPNTSRVEEQFERGKRALSTFSKLLDAKESLRSRIFRPFGSMEVESRKTANSEEKL